MSRDPAVPGRPAVRPAVHRDEQAVHDLAAAMATTFAVDRDAFRTAFRGLLDAEGAMLLVVDVDGRVGGYVLAFVHPAFFANGPVVRVEEIAVRPELRRERLGTVLMADVERRAGDLGARLVTLATRRAAEFYGALGYEPSATYFRKFVRPSR